MELESLWRHDFEVSGLYTMQQTLMKPQMLFGMVMAVVNTFQVGHIGVSLSGSNPTPQYAGQLIVNLIEDYGFIRYEMGYASAASVALLLLIYFVTKQAGKLFKED